MADPRIAIVREWFETHWTRHTEDHGLPATAPRELLALLDAHQESAASRDGGAVERVAECIHVASCQANNIAIVLWLHLTEGSRDHWRVMSRAAIAAMKEPK